jgi:hypothetical protein
MTLIVGVDVGTPARGAARWRGITVSTASVRTKIFRAIGNLLSRLGAGAESHPATDTTLAVTEWLPAVTNGNSGRYAIGRIVEVVYAAQPNVHGGRRQMRPDPTKSGMNSTLSTVKVTQRR